MSLPDIVSREEWLQARKALLEREKELTRLKDQLNADRRRLPMVEIDKPYVFEGPDGPARLIDLFEGRRQLFVQHFMFDPAWDTGCPACTSFVDELSNGLMEHLHIRDTTFALISRAPLEKIEAYRKSEGWDIPWYSSFGSDFNYDFNVTFDESVQPLLLNFRTREELAAPENEKLHWFLEEDQPSEGSGFSCFLRDGERVFQTYFVTGRGTEQIIGGYGFLDFTALGRQEGWEEPKGRTDNPRPAMPTFSS
jgi:predicted dithiol-disulfide oxidoreductase (DUF899 family)